MQTNNTALSGKNVVVIGGTSGIGLATAIAASQLGATVWTAGRSAAHMDKAAAAIAAAGVQVTLVTLDTHDEVGMNALFTSLSLIHI